MKISVLGLGYVGAVSGACLAELGHEVIGVDVDYFKVETVNNGLAPIVEELIGELTAEMVEKGRFRATCDVAEAIRETELSMVCVGTPSAPTGELDTTYVRRVCEEIGAELKKKDAYHLVVIRSTVLPQTMERIVTPALETASGKRCGEDFGLCFHPEFLREGTSVKDFRDPPKVVIGAYDEKSADMLASIYEGFTAPLFVTSMAVAEMVKYVDNSFHALKVVFGNEIGAIAKSLNIDSHEVMRIFCEDRKLNISPYYLMPGFAYGGSCLPKDLRALLHLARAENVEVPMLASLARSNEEHIKRTVERVLALGKRQVAMLGLSFKSGTDDLRESPLVELVERLLGKGCKIRIWDDNVSLARLRGGNKAYIESRLPHISELLNTDLDAVIDGAEVIIVGTGSPHFAKALNECGDSKNVIDLVRLFKDEEPPIENYDGVCW